MVKNNTQPHTRLAQHHASLEVACTICAQMVRDSRGVKDVSGS